MTTVNHAKRLTNEAAAHGLRSPSALPLRHCPPPTAHRPLPHRGISLLEVLISMFVLLFGLMGVAAIFPVGNHYATQGDKYDRDIATVDVAFAELQTRGMLQPEHWLYASKPANVPGAADLAVPVMNQLDDFSQNPIRRKDQFYIPIPPAGSTASVDHPGYAYVIDPLGAAAAAEANSVTSNSVPNAWAFPWWDMGEQDVNTVMPTAGGGSWKTAGLTGQNWPIRRVGLDVDPRPGVNQKTSTDPGNPNGMPTALAQAVFQLHDDLTVELPAQSDRPGIQRWSAYDDGAGNFTALSRANLGNYSWLATVVPATADDAVDSADALETLQPAHPVYGQKFYDVSVAVFYKRNATPSAETERLMGGELLPGGQLIIHDAVGNDPDVIDASVQGIRPGQWIAVTGVLPATRKNGTLTPAQLLLKWYRVLALDDENQEEVPVHLNPSSTNIEAGRLGRYAMLDGPDWPNVAGLSYIPNLRVILLPGVIGVTTRSLRMEADSTWTPQNYPQ